MPGQWTRLEHKPLACPAGRAAVALEPSVASELQYVIINWYLEAKWGDKQAQRVHHGSEPWPNPARLFLRTFRADGSPPSAEGVMHSYGQMLLCPRTETALRSQHRPRDDHRGERLCGDRWAPHGSEPGASVTPPAGLPPCPRQPVPPWSLRHCCQRACSLRLGGQAVDLWQLQRPGRAARAGSGRQGQCAGGAPKPQAVWPRLRVRIRCCCAGCVWSTRQHRRPRNERGRAR